MIPSIALLLLASCSDDTPWEGHFDGPVAAAVLLPDQGGPFSEPIGFVSNTRSGRITLLDLKQGVFLADDPASSFLRSSYVATGRRRILGDVAVHAPDVSTVTVFVADMENGLLVEAPYIIGAEGGWPLEVEPIATDPVFVDADGSGDQVTVTDLTLRAGYTTTERWVLEYDGDKWVATGSRSGVQYLTGVMGEAYHTGYREVELTLEGTATAGDRVEFDTDTGIREHDVGGRIQALSMSPDQSLLALSVYDPDTDLSSLVFFDPATRTVSGTVPLDEGAMPYRMDWSVSGDLLFVADARLAAAWQITPVAADPGASGVERIDLPGPLLDLSYLEAEGHQHLLAATLGENAIWVWDVAQGTLLDVNPLTEGADPMYTTSPVTGLGHVPLPVPTQEYTEFGARREQNVAAVSLFEGKMVLMDFLDGCLVKDAYGPRSYESSEDSYAFADYGASSSPYMWEDEATGKHVQVNDCAGIAVEETWDVVFNENLQAWEVEGSRSGEQESLAYNDIRYVNDDASISFTVMDGVLPATDGDRYRVTVKDGVMAFSDDLDLDGEDERTFELPARPVPFWYDAGPTGGGWDPLDRRAFVLLPLTNSDFVVRARLSGGVTEVVWD